MSTEEKALFDEGQKAYLASIYLEKQEYYRNRKEDDDKHERVKEITMSNAQSIRALMKVVTILVVPFLLLLISVALDYLARR